MEVASSSKYQHTPLKPGQIRLLKLYPALLQGGRQCLAGSLRTIELKDDSPAEIEYDALSYCWGDVTDVSHCISIAGRHFGIPSNLYHFLLRAQDRHKSRPFWIDFICIDQSDLLERQDQVSMMAQIYRGAFRTVIWLGEATDDSHLAFKLLELLYKQFANLMKERTVISYIMHILRKDPLTKPHSPAWIALGNIMARPWFRRTWVIQEAALATDSDFLCGGESVSWLVMAWNVWLINMYELRYFTAPAGDTRHYRSGDSGWLTMKILRDIRTCIYEKSPWRLSPLLMALNLFYATDPRDKIYGILAIAADSSELKICPDYSISTPVVYLEVTRQVLLRDRSLNLLSMAGTGWPVPAPSELPSWVPDYTNPGRNYWDTDVWEFQWAYSCGSVSDISFSCSGTELHLTGYVATCVTKLGPAKGISIEHDDLTSWLCGTWDMFQESGIGIARFLGLLSGHKLDPTGLNSSEIDVYLSAYLAVFWSHHPSGTSLKRCLSGKVSPVMGNDLHRAQHFKSFIRTTINGRRLCETERGLFGLVPSGTVVGDIICVFPGGKGPFVIRPIQEADSLKQKYRLVGMCQVHGLTRHEVLALGLPKEQIVLL